MIVDLAASADSIASALAERGMRAEVDFGPGPTDVIVVLDGASILAACCFNTDDGWEAALETYDGGQRCLLDGPSVDAPDEDVVEWLTRLAGDPLKYLA